VPEVSIYTTIVNFVAVNIINNIETNGAIYLMQYRLPRYLLSNYFMSISYAKQNRNNKLSIAASSQIFPTDITEQCA